MKPTVLPPKRRWMWYVLIPVVLGMVLTGCDQALSPLDRGGNSGKLSKGGKHFGHLNAGETVQITEDPADQVTPDISMGQIVYTDNRSGDFDIYLYQMRNRKEKRITDDPSDQIEPAISGEHILWADQRVESGQDIFSYNLSTKSETQLTDTPEPDNETEPVVSGDYAIWYTGFRWYYEAYNLAEDTNSFIGSTGPGDGGYGISGGLAVLTGYGGTDPSDLYLCDLTAESEDCELLFHEEGRAARPDIDGDYVVWQDDRNGNYDIFLYDRTTQTETQITSDTTGQRDPQIWGNYITWVDSRNGNEDIYLYHIETQEETQITADTSAQRHPAIFENYLVWEDHRNGNSDIYLYKIEENPKGNGRKNDRKGNRRGPK